MSVGIIMKQSKVILRRYRECRLLIGQEELCFKFLSMEKFQILAKPRLVLVVGIRIIF